MRQARLSGVFVDNGLPGQNQKCVVSYGGGVNAIACLIRLAHLGVTPDAIVMADPGSEWPETHHYREAVLPPWLDANGFSRPILISRAEEAVFRQEKLPREDRRYETLEEECLRINALPSAAYGFGKCSAKYKGEAQRWWAARQAWCQAEWAAGRKIKKVIGYDADEPGRVVGAFQSDWENARFEPWYPLHAAGFTRDDCAEMILAEGLPLPPKSSCTFCPNNTEVEWRRLKVEHPELYERAVLMSRNAKLDAPEVVGLLRRFPTGMRQLHEWVDGKYPTIPYELTGAMPCVCDL